ncbi:hypothetical protein CON84_20080, partial [Bacillus sp. AFS094228]
MLRPVQHQHTPGKDKKRNWVKDHGLLLVNAGLFVVFLGGMILSGAASYSEEQQAHG